MRMKHGSDRRPTISVKPRLLAAFTAVAMMFATAVPSLLPQTAVGVEEEPAEVPGAICTPQDISMGDNTSSAQKDDGIATWVGQDMYVGAPTGASTYNATTQPHPSYAVEAEGTTLVAGKLAINAKKHSWNNRGFRFGIVGFGAQYRPSAGSDSLVVDNTHSVINLVDLNNVAVSALGYNVQGRGWIGTTNDKESNYNAKINGKESAAIGLKGMTPGSEGYPDGVPADSGWRSIYSTSAGSTVTWGATNPLKTVNINGVSRDYSGNTKTITELSDTLGKIPAPETSKVTTNLTAPSTSQYGYVREKYNSDKKNDDDGTAVHIGVRMTFNESNYKEKMIEFDGGSQNQNSTIVFDVNASDLNSDNANGLVFRFKNIKEGASVVVNVKGNQNVEFHNGWRFWWNGEEISNGYVWDAKPEVKKAYEQASQAIMWNFQNTPKLTILGGVLTGGQAERWANKTDENNGGKVIAGTTSNEAITVKDDPAAAMIGSILVPRGSFEDHVTTNGRVWVGKDFMMYNPTVAANFPDGVGEGESSSVIDMDQERHNFPWKGSMRSECSTISWNKVDEQGNLLEGSTWGVYKSKQDAIDEQNALYPSVKDNDIPSGDWNPTAGKFRVDSLEPNARYFLKELTAPAGYEKSDLIYVIKTTEKGDVSNKDIIAVYNADGSENKNPDSWKLANVVGETDTKGIANSPEGGMIQWGKYEDGKDKTGLPGSVWKLTKTGEGDWTQEITDNTKAVEGIALYNGNDDVTNGSLTVTEGTTLQLTHRVSPDDATQDVTWESSDPTAAEVQNGHVTVLHVPADGQPVTITATTVDTNASGDRLSAHVALTIQEVALNSLTLKYNGQTDPSEISTTVGNNITLTATADPPSLQSSITWDSTDKTVATVENGVVTPHEAGSTTIWAKCKDDQSKWKSVDINVTNPVANTTTVYVHWLNASTAPRIHYWDSNNEGSTWGTRPTMETASCAGNDWYKYDVPFAGKPFNVKVTMGNDNNVYKVNGSADIPIAGTARAYNIDGGKVNSSAPAGCVTRAAVPSQAANDAELTLAPKSDATDEASIQTFRRARLNTMAESQPGANATTQYKDSNSMVGQFTILGLPDGEYTLTEKTAPSGYLLNTTVYTFTMSGGKVTWTGDKQPSIVGDMAWISDKPTQVVWEKVDSDNNNAPLAGSGWTIEQKSIVDGQEKWTPINEVMDCTEAPCNASVKYKDEDPTPGKFLVKKLPVGTYRITETTVPDGYEAVGGPYEFTVTDREETVRVNGKPLGNTRKKGKVYWGKVSSEDDTRFLAGSAWKVTYIPYGKTEADKVEVDITDCVQSDGSSTGTCSAADATKAPWAYDAYGAEGRIGFDNLPWGSYEMIETKAPDGYYADPDVSYVFSVGPDTPDDQFQNLVIYKKDTATGATTPLPNYPNQVISNEPGVVLPATGGEGNTLIVLFGFVLIAISMLGCGVAMRKRI
ncbi:SpaA isopeptide-forming pilin-related protein [Bifidobacterium pseudolongum]|uniref:SpaA isopeptide-forming pilin-related protein n=1 Tax=Bifidobacterium pseudolongum TaxID=1694 RepID=UPI0005299E35|nr:SpaA isopeptide-forming pilin-related protein [Bifidobacterium pseudolongum]UNP91603.1 Ig-like domain-containing protein [Bifidobacterium pseudolongum subsp. pseudolongum]WCA40676.1 SpaA isopeptide-forming pilin-related protein [Bifidobacterium pseudolongum subsp. pseudolongum]